MKSPRLIWIHDSEYSAKAQTVVGNFIIGPCTHGFCTCTQYWMPPIQGNVRTTIRAAKDLAQEHCDLIFSMREEQILHLIEEVKKSNSPERQQKKINYLTKYYRWNF